MVNDEELNSPETDEPEIWAPVHALRLLGEFRNEALIQPLLQVLTDHESDEAIQEEIPRVFGLIGPAAIAALSDYLADSSHTMYARSYASDGLYDIAENFPEYRSSCIEGMTRTIERFEENDIELNAFLIADLARLKAVDTVPLIEKAFEEGMVDEFIIDLDYHSFLWG
jgi:HEAT repeat protein